MELSESDLRAALAANPADLESERLLGILCARSRQFAEGAERLGKIVRLYPDDFDSLIWLAVAQKGLRDFDSAIASCRQAIELRPSAAVAYHTLGQTFLAQRTSGPAIEALQRATILDPQMAPAFHSLGNALLLENRATEATAAFRKVTEIAPGDLQGYLSLGDELVKSSDTSAAIECFEQARRLFPQMPKVLMKLAGAYALDDRADKAEKYFKLAMSYDPSASAAYGLWLQEMGRPKESAVAFRQSIAVQPMQGFAYFGLAQASPLDIESEIRAKMSELAEHPRLHMLEKMYLAYAEGLIEDRAKNFETAMAKFDLANDLAYQVHNAGRAFNREQQTLIRDHTIAEYEAHSTPIVASESDKPILIVGMIRSGTTLLDQMISAHPEVASAGELRYWIEEGAKRRGKETLRTDLSPGYLQELDRYGKGAARVTDKMPLNYAQLGLIHRSLPNARIIHIRRNPIDTCLSIYTTYLGPSPYFAYRRDNIVFYYREYLRVMEFWRSQLPADRFLEIDYEALVSDPLPIMERILSFCNLPWDPACLSPEKNLGVIRTPSLWQARNPVSTASVERWKRYEPWLREFAELG